ncbi:hypothetical protein BC629DRAFT_1531220 [Irpex lacteus]|nr:hypothetical protein BC629DRAFT_1531220 [Irpex lacteus]
MNGLRRVEEEEGGDGEGEEKKEKSRKKELESQKARIVAQMMPSSAPTPTPQEEDEEGERENVPPQPKSMKSKRSMAMKAKDELASITPSSSTQTATTTLKGFDAAACLSTNALRLHSYFHYISFDAIIRGPRRLPLALSAHLASHSHSHHALNKSQVARAYRQIKMTGFTDRVVCSVRIRMLASGIGREEAGGGLTEEEVKSRDCLKRQFCA